jgi:hypothetical protein
MESFTTFGMCSEWCNQMQMTYIFLRGRIWPLIKYSNNKLVIPGASWMKAENEDDAVRKWDLAAEQGATKRIF